MRWFEKLPVLPSWVLMTMAALGATLSLLSLLDVYKWPGTGFLFLAWYFLLLKAGQAEEERKKRSNATTL